MYPKNRILNRKLKVPHKNAQKWTKTLFEKTRTCTKSYKNDAIRNDVISPDENYFQTAALILRFHKISMGILNPTRLIRQSVILKFSFMTFFLTKSENRTK